MRPQSQHPIHTLKCSHQWGTSIQTHKISQVLTPMVCLDPHTQTLTSIAFLNPHTQILAGSHTNGVPRSAHSDAHINGAPGSTQSDAFINGAPKSTYRFSHQWCARNKAATANKELIPPTCALLGGLHNKAFSCAVQLRMMHVLTSMVCSH